MRRAISIQAEPKKLLEKQTFRAVSCESLFGGDDDKRSSND